VPGPPVTYPFGPLPLSPEDFGEREALSDALNRPNADTSISSSSIKQVQAAGLRAILSVGFVLNLSPFAMSEDFCDRFEPTTITCTRFNAVARDP
jgi:hypothetical protein